MPPKVIAKNADRTGGVLPVPAAARAKAPKPPANRLKLEVRRLPPGLTLAEFEETLGDEWKLGNGKVDWREYRQGKLRAAGSGKVPEQSRCYLHLINEACVKEFEKRFLEVLFQDKAATHKVAELKNLQPTLSFALNQRTPLQQPKQRTDNRQGTIDQDPEFIAFLESETQPIFKPPALDAPGVDKEADKKEVKTTPLIEDLREKKANKAKAAQAKAEKAEKEKKSQAAKASNKDGTAVAEKDGGKSKKVEQAAKDAAKALNSQAAGKQPTKSASPAKAKKAAQNLKQQQQQPAAARSTPPAATAATSNASTPAPQRAPPNPRQRGNADGIKKMLQKDLGIKPKAATSASPTNASTPSTPTATSSTAGPPPQSPPAITPALPAETKAPPVKAYLKHANPSQGMTEILIQQALAEYGEVASVTIDPRKGTAIAVFKQNEGLKKALEAKHVSVANGAVEVLEFRDRSAAGSGARGGFRGGRGGRGGGRGGAQAAAPVTAAATSTASAPGPVS